MSTLPTGWTKRSTGDRDGGFTVSVYNAVGTHVGHYRFVGFGQALRWRVLGVDYATEAEAEAAVVRGES